MKRRECIALLGGAAVWPLAARAQKPEMPAIGFLDWASPRPNASMVPAFREGLAEAGFVEGKNLAVEYRWANGQFEQLSALAADLVRRQVAVIVATGALSPARAAKAATSTIPIVFVYTGDPVKEGLVASLNRPGGNVTGVTVATDLAGKRLGLLREMAPQATTVAFLSGDSSFWLYERQTSSMLGAGRGLGLEVIVVECRSDRDFEMAFSTIEERRAAALILGTYPLGDLNKVVALAARHKIPAMYPGRRLALAGGLMSYGASFAGIYRQAGIYTGRILKGERPVDLPVQLPTKFELVINLKTAVALGLTVPPTLLAITDEVIE